MAGALQTRRVVFQEEAGAAYLAARVAAFIAAHGTVRLCADCVARTVPKRMRKANDVTEAGWCESCGSHVPEVFRLAVSEYGRALRRRRAAPASTGVTGRPSEGAPPITARCPICSDVIDVSDSPRLVFRPDGRVEHGRCPDPVCPWCLQTVTPSQPKLRSGRDIFHRDCLRASWSEGAIAGGSAASCTAIFDQSQATRVQRDRIATAELVAMTREVVADAIGVRALARSVRAQSAERRYWNRKGMRASPSD
jgi:hypothetical protein